MDKRTLRERRRRKQLQLRRRKMIRLGIYGAGALLLAVFVIRGVIRPIVNRIVRQGAADEEAVQTQVSLADPDAAVRQPLKGVADLAKLTVMTSGWHEDESGRWYQNPDGTYFSGGFQSIDGVQYFFDPSGYAVTGWMTRGAKDYYFNDDGSYNPNKQRPVMALTFDDGPGEYTDRLLDCLEANNAHATFFMLGELVNEYPDTVKRMLELGCELGNHSWDHEDQTTLSLDAVEKQFSDTDNALQSVCGQKATVARAPYGAYTDEIIATVGKPFFLWSLDSLDWEYRDAELDYEAIMNDPTLGDGTIILMHDIHEPSVECAVRLIPDLIEMGYKLVTVSELAEIKNVRLENASYSDFWESSLISGLVPGYKGDAMSALPQTQDVITDSAAGTDESEDDPESEKTAADYENELFASESANPGGTSSSSFSSGDGEDTEDADYSDGDEEDSGEDAESEENYDDEEYYEEEYDEEYDGEDY
ncbi:MAG: polysaccharide deacetylase family protein [Blautia sp.]|nr:polysaccharide deacetylase family protein [Blautia sp.]